MRRSLLVPLYVLMVFLSGALVGGMGYRLYTAKVIAAPNLQPHHLTPEEWRKKRIEEMRNRLKLSDEQVSKVQAVYDETKQQMAAYNQRSKAELKSIHDQQTQKIHSILNQDQQVEYDKLRQEREVKERQKHQAAEEKKNHPGS
jgi:hypothetical protein